MMGDMLHFVLYSIQFGRAEARCAGLLIAGVPFRHKHFNHVNASCEIASRTKNAE